MRTIETHKVNSPNDKLTIEVRGEPGPGGANHEYLVTLPSGESVQLNFQNGPVAVAGVNGLTHEVLLAIVVDRLKSFQAGPFAGRENALALTKIEEAQHWLFARTLERMQRGVEGTYKR